MKKDQSENQKLLDHIAGFAKSLFDETGEIMPMWFLEDKNGMVQPAVTPFDGDDSKDICVEEIKGLMRKFRAVRYGFMAEAWSLSLPKEHPDFDRANDGQSIQPSKHRDRREIVKLLVEDDQGGFLFGQFFILRPEHGKPALSPFHQEEGFDNIGGRFSGLLQRV
jgi:hypothetical protein